MSTSVQAKSSVLSIPAYHTPYVAMPKEGSADAIIIKALTLEEGFNVNGWRVLPEYFQSVADQYKAGRQLRVNHDKLYEKIIGKSFDGKVLKGSEVEEFLGAKVNGINPNGKYVGVSFEATPEDPQIRTNILKQYCVTGSIGMDADAFCAQCGKPLVIGSDGKSMERTCYHLDAQVDLKDPDVKEYSYVAEPAFDHTRAFPSFSAALDSKTIITPQKSEVKAEESSLSKSETSIDIPMSKVEVTAKKAESEGEGDAEADADAMAAKYISYYNKGAADAVKNMGKFKADSDGDDDDKKKDNADASVKADSDSEADGKKADAEGESDADAAAPKSPPMPDKNYGKGQPSGKFGAQKTDQVGRETNSQKTEVIGSDFMDRLYHPSKYALENPAMREVFNGAAEMAPSSIRANLQKAVKGRFD